MTAPHPHTEEHPIDGGKSAFGKLTVLMVTAFIDMLGMLMILPLLPFYAKELGAGGFVVGLLVSSFSVAQLLSAPMWGRFSDKHGRRPALMVGLASSAIAYVVFAYADRMIVLARGRLIAEGKPLEIRDHPKVQEVYFGSGKTFEKKGQSDMANKEAA